MTSSSLMRILTAVFSAGLAFAADNAVATMSGPRLGLVFDPAAGSLRLITGIPGAAITGEVLRLGLAISRAEISPTGDAALAVAADSSVALVSAAGGDWVAASLGGAPPAPDRMAFSPGGTAAALYYAAGRVEVLTGLPGAASVAGDIDVSGLPAPVTAMALNDAASFLLMAAGPPESVSLYLVSMGSAPSLVNTFRSVSALRLFDAGRQALVTDALAGTVYLIADPAGAAALQVAATRPDGIQGLVAAETDAAGQRVFAVTGAGTVYVFNLAGVPVATLDCGCAPAGLFRLAGPATFRLTELAAGPLQVLDASGAPRIVAVPPPARAVARSRKPL